MYPRLHKKNAKLKKHTVYTHALKEKRAHKDFYSDAFASSVGILRFAIFLHQVAVIKPQMVSQMCKMCQLITMECSSPEPQGSCRRRKQSLKSHSR